MIVAQHSRPMRIDGNEHYLKAGDLVDVSEELEPVWATVAGFTIDCPGGIDASGWCDGDCDGVILFADAEPWHLPDSTEVTARIQVEA